jgi:hypothetical protein
MMVTLWKSVECSAKIAMTTLHRGREAMCLLPIHDLPRLIFLDAPGVTNLLILEWAEEPVSSAKCDTKVIIKASSAVPMRVHTDEIRSTGIFFHLCARRRDFRTGGTAAWKT